MEWPMIIDILNELVITRMSNHSSNTIPEHIVHDGNYFIFSFIHNNLGREGQVKFYGIFNHKIFQIFRVYIYMDLHLNNWQEFDNTQVRYYEFLLIYTFQIIFMN